MNMKDADAFMFTTTQILPLVVSWQGFFRLTQQPVPEIRFTRIEVCEKRKQRGMQVKLEFEEKKNGSRGGSVFPSGCLS